MGTKIKVRSSLELRDSNLYSSHIHARWDFNKRSTDINIFREEYRIGHTASLNHLLHIDKLSTAVIYRLNDIIYGINLGYMVSSYITDFIEDCVYFLSVLDGISNYLRNLYITSDKLGE